MAFWVKFETGEPGCVEVEFEKMNGLSPKEQTSLVIETAERETGRKVVSVDRIPYPASPRLVKVYYEIKPGVKEACPSFCYSPEQCKGRSSCPKNYSCCE
ncbi:hypothetical protein [Parasphingorhabdus sp.]|uniref:hypothetical protein n=1 Tax=Parasphingorhabdus sp. TaxID=2709688 RepID=UPI003A8D0650